MAPCYVYWRYTGQFYNALRIHLVYVQGATHYSSSRHLQLFVGALDGRTNFIIEYPPVLHACIKTKLNYIITAAACDNVRKYCNRNQSGAVESNERNPLGRTPRTILYNIIAGGGPRDVYGHRGGGGGERKRVGRACASETIHKRLFLFIIAPRVTHDTERRAMYCMRYVELLHYCERVQKGCKRPCLLFIYIYVCVCYVSGDHSPIVL